MSTAIAPRNGWTRGLFRRIALAFVGLIAVILVAQVLIFVWLLRQQSVSADYVHQRGLAWTRAMSAELAEGLRKSPSLDVSQRLAQLDVTKRVYVVFRDGRVVGKMPPSIALNTVLHDFPALGDNDPIPQTWERSSYCGALLKVDGKTVGVLGIVPQTTFERFAPLIVPGGLVIVTLSILLFSFVVVRPVRSRLMDLQSVARRLGTGELDARAHAQGSDEVSELAQTFNSMADELQQRTTALETSDRLRRQLVADVSHELMTPLTAVLGHLETLDMDGVVLQESDRRKQVAIARREAQRLRRVIGDLVNTARYEAGGVQLDVAEISTEALFRQIESRHELECRSRGVSFETSVPADVDTFEADPFRIEQAIENVVTNALRHTPNGGRVSLSAHREGDQIVVEVCDSGEGIAAEHLPFIFDRFYKASSARGIASPGSGLGLSIVKAIVTRHAGRVSATSASGVGTIVRIELPSKSPLVEQPAWSADTV